LHSHFFTFSLLHILTSSHSHPFKFSFLLPLLKNEKELTLLSAASGNTFYVKLFLILFSN
jgi:hypothetical protein